MDLKVNKGILIISLFGILDSYRLESIKKMILKLNMKKVIFDLKEASIKDDNLVFKDKKYKSMVCNDKSNILNVPKVNSLIQALNIMGGNYGY